MTFRSDSGEVQKDVIVFLWYKWHFLIHNESEGLTTVMSGCMMDQYTECPLGEDVYGTFTRAGHGRQMNRS